MRFHEFSPYFFTKLLRRASYHHSGQNQSSQAKIALTYSIFVESSDFLFDIALGPFVLISFSVFIRGGLF